MRVTVKLFGPLALTAKSREVILDLRQDRPTCSDLESELAAACPALGAQLRTAAFAVNSEYVNRDHVVDEGDEIALIGFVSGG